MAQRGGQRRPRQQRPQPAQVVDLNLKPALEAIVAAAPSIAGPPPPPPPAQYFGLIVSYRINSAGVDERRPAVILREDAPGVATLFVFTLPGDEIAAAARVAQQRAVSRPRGNDVGEWSPLAVNP